MSGCTCDLQVHSKLWLIFHRDFVTPTCSLTNFVFVSLLWMYTLTFFTEWLYMWSTSTFWLILRQTMILLNYNFTDIVSNICILIYILTETVLNKCSSNLPLDWYCTKHVLALHFDWHYRQGVLTDLLLDTVYLWPTFVPSLYRCIPSEFCQYAITFLRCGHYTHQFAPCRSNGHKRYVRYAASVWC